MHVVKWEKTLIEVLRMDDDPGSAAATVNAIEQFWPSLDGAGSLVGVYKAALVYSLNMTPTLNAEGDVVKKWEMTQVEPDVPLAQTWEEFCLSHLAMSSKAASAYKRLWQIYHIGLGRDVEELVRCGLFRLRAACGTIAKMIKNGAIDHRLLNIMFGDANTPPISRGAFLLLLGQLKEPADPLPGKLQLTVEIDQFAIAGHLHITVSLTQDDQVSHIDAWQVRCIEDDAPADATGIRVSHVESFMCRVRQI